MDCSPPGSSVHGVSQARISEWVTISFSRGSSWPKDWTQVSCIADRFSTTESTGKLIYLGCAGSSLLHRFFSSCSEWGLLSSYCVWDSHCGGFSCSGAGTPGAEASVAAAHRLSSCDTRARLLQGMWDLPGPRMEPKSPALAGRFLTTEQPGNPLTSLFSDLKSHGKQSVPGLGEGKCQD